MNNPPAIWCGERTEEISVAEVWNSKPSSGENNGFGSGDGIATVWSEKVEAVDVAVGSEPGKFVGAFLSLFSAGVWSSRVSFQRWQCRVRFDIGCRAAAFAFRPRSKLRSFLGDSIAGRPEEWRGKTGKFSYVPQLTSRVYVSSFG